MGQSYEAITDAQRAFINEQRMFFVATAPSGAGGHVNLSPKGHDTLRVLGPNRVAYLDLTGSGAETIAHIRDNGRITLMFCAFAGRPNIVRLYGSARALFPGDPGFAALAGRWEPIHGTRAIIEATIERTSDSCGFSVPLMDYAGERETLFAWCDHRSEEELAAYRARNNAVSIDGLPAVPAD